MLPSNVWLSLWKYWAPETRSVMSPDNTNGEPMISVALPAPWPVFTWMDWIDALPSGSREMSPPRAPLPPEAVTVPPEITVPSRPAP